MVVPVDDVGRLSQGVQIRDDGDGRPPQLVRDRSQPAAISDGCMAAIEQARGHVADVQLRAGPIFQGVVGDQHPQPAHRRIPSTYWRTRSISGTI